MEPDPDLGTPEGDRLDILATLVQAYEAKHVPITAPDPVEASKSANGPNQCACQTASARR